MDDNQTSEQIDLDRRSLLGAATTGILAAGASSLFPAHVAAAGEDAIRPFRINVPEEQLVDLGDASLRRGGRTGDGCR
jgi:hypothetical protein